MIVVLLFPLLLGAPCNAVRVRPPRAQTLLSDAWDEGPARKLSLEELERIHDCSGFLYASHEELCQSSSSSSSSSCAMPSPVPPTARGGHSDRVALGALSQVPGYVGQMRLQRHLSKPRLAAGIILHILKDFKVAPPKGVAKARFVRELESRHGRDRDWGKLDEDADARRAEAVNAETLRVEDEDQKEMVIDAD